MEKNNLSDHIGKSAHRIMKVTDLLFKRSSWRRRNRGSSGDRKGGEKGEKVLGGRE